ncbi:MAG: UDP-glucose 4-epimerase GalE [Candidatus Delongbacteria bacterium]|nr:UDP-glucose 4-epimerase GalE [Candidatus Delongbacteria bacterium]
MKSAILISGGAGYIGSATVAYLISRHQPVVIVDNFSTGHRDAIHPQAIFYQGDIQDESLIDLICQRHHIESVIHFAASALVGESMIHPDLYYVNNVAATACFTRSLIRNQVRRLVFSSTAATYGIPTSMPIVEEEPQHPINPYGRSKLMIEQILDDYDQAYGFRSIRLRYFNACGAYENWGEDHRPETHLIPNLIRAALAPEHPFILYGQDYPTSDGTCIRDYIHIHDLAAAHLLALQYLWENEAGLSLNLGNGYGFSNLEVLKATEQILNRQIPIERAPRRPGDPAVLIASSQKARKILGWEPQYSSLESIIRSAVEWHRRFPDGYAR